MKELEWIFENDSDYQHIGAEDYVNGSQVELDNPYFATADTPTERDLSRQTTFFHSETWAVAKEELESLGHVLSRGTEKIATFNGFAREVFSRMFEVYDLPAKDEIADHDRWAGSLHSVMDELPETKQLKSQTMGDTFWSGVATGALTDSLIDQLPDDIAQDLQDPERLEKMIDLMEGLDSPMVEAEVADLLEQKNASEVAAKALAEYIEKSRETIRASVRRAMTRASEEVQDGKKLFSAVPGMSPGEPHKMEASEKIALGKRMLNSPKFREIVDLAGRFRRTANKAEMTESRDVRSEVHSVTRGKDILRILPTQLATSDGPFESLFYSRFSEGSLPQYDLKGKEKMGKGPIVVCVDNSGSMTGEREFFSKAVTFLMAERCRRENRGFALVHFDHSVQYVEAFRKGETHCPKRIIDAMEFFSGGGTNFNGALNHAMDVCDGSDLEANESQNADVFVITDGYGEISSEVLDRIDDLKKRRKTRFFPVILEGSGSQFDSFSSKTITASDLDLSNDLSAIEEIFSF